MKTPHIETRPFINGAHVKAKSGRTFSTTNPADETTLAEIEEADVDDVNDAVAAACEAARGKWAQFDGRKRQAVLWKLGELIQQNNDELALLETLDAGKTLFDSGKVEVPLAAEVFKYFAGYATKITGETFNQSGSLRYTLKTPVGVCGQIVPWNFPLLMASWKIAPALAAGNTVVLKPAELTPLTALRLGALANEAGIPPGVLNIVPGFGATAGRRLVEHDDVKKIAFTGSTAVGKDIAARAASTLKRVSLELGGKSPNIIFADADLKSAIRGALTGIFYNKGEVCAAGSRLLVERSIVDDVVAALTAQAAKMTVGDPTLPTTRMGPLASRAQYEKVLSYVEKGKASGAKLAHGGTPVDVNGKGFFVAPTVFSDVDPESPIATDEIFGPVLSVIAFDDVDDALKKANQNRYGLAAGVFTADVKKAFRVAHALEAGTVWINTYNLYDPSMPFGGFKESGYGRDLGSSAIDQYTDTKSVWVDLN